MRDVTRAFKALSDETRLRILNLLMERECCVCEVMQALQISQTRASRNLGILQDAGFLGSRRDGVWTTYFIDHEGMPEHLRGLVEVVRGAAQDLPELERDRERLRSAVRVGPGCCAG